MHQRRKEKDVMKLLMSSYKVESLNEQRTEFIVDFHAPSDSLYEGGLFKVHVELPEQYPIKSPSVGFMTKIFHPNIDLQSGTVCLDVINQTWSPMFDLKNVFDVFLPQLLLYPNPHHPLNNQAAALLLKKPEEYARHVREMVAKHAKPDLAAADEALSDISRDDLSELSDTSGLDEDLLAELLLTKREKLDLSKVRNADELRQERQRLHSLRSNRYFQQQATKVHNDLRMQSLELEYQALLAASKRTKEKAASRAIEQKARELKLATIRVKEKLEESIETARKLRERPVEWTGHSEHSSPRGKEEVRHILVQRGDEVLRLHILGEGSESPRRDVPKKSLPELPILEVERSRPKKSATEIEPTKQLEAAAVPPKKTESVREQESPAAQTSKKTEQINEPESAVVQPQSIKKKIRTLSDLSHTQVAKSQFAESPKRQLKPVKKPKEHPKNPVKQLSSVPLKTSRETNGDKEAVSHSHHSLSLGPDAELLDPVSMQMGSESQSVRESERRAVDRKEMSVKMMQYWKDRVKPDFHPTVGCSFFAEPLRGQEIDLRRKLTSLKRISLPELSKTLAM